MAGGDRLTPASSVGADRAVLSARNPRLATLRRLSGRRSARTDAGRFVIDGPRLVREALDAGIGIDEVYVPADQVASAAVVDLERALRAAGVAVHLVAPDAFQSVASTESPQPAIAVARPPVHDATELLASADALLVLVDVADPGNAGTLVRVAEAAGIGVVVACGQGVEWWNPKVVRAAAGSLFRVPVLTFPDVHDVLATLHARGVTTLATSLGGGADYTAVDYGAPMALLLGSEAHGLAPDVVSAATTTVRIPMLGAVESLNVAMAGAVCAFELARQRRGAGNPDRPGPKREVRTPRTEYPGRP
jgi:TrmH family RNA methyltransferase